MVFPGTAGRKDFHENGFSVKKYFPGATGSKIFTRTELSSVKNVCARRRRQKEVFTKKGFLRKKGFLPGAAGGKLFQRKKVFRKNMPSPAPPEKNSLPQNILEKALSREEVMIILYVVSKTRL